MPPVEAFIRRHLNGASVVVDPFCGESELAGHRNDLRRDAKAGNHLDARDWLRMLRDEPIEADAVLLDPPYSPRQISEVYKSVGRSCTVGDTQNARLYKECIDLMDAILKPGGVALRFGWNSMGFPKGRYERLETLLVNHGAAHNDTICTADRKLKGLFP